MLNISVDLYQPDPDQVQRLVSGLLQAEEVRNIYLTDNSPVEIRTDARKNLFSSKKIHYRWNGGKDSGFCVSHNTALRESVWQRTKYHLVMDAGIDVKAEDIDRLHHFMEHNPQVGQVMPKMADREGKTLYRCGLLPSPWDVFFPVFIGKKRRYCNELRATGYDTMMNVPRLSGRFMFLRTEAALQARLFDERYTAYAGPLDMTRTIHRKYLTLYLPDITVTDNGQIGGYGFWNRNHTADMVRYFNKWGWVFDAERKETNQLTLQLCMQAK